MLVLTQIFGLKHFNYSEQVQAEHFNYAEQVQAEHFNHAEQVQAEQKSNTCNNISRGRGMLRSQRLTHAIG